MTELENNMEYFTSEKISKHITRIIECTGVCFYLVEGSEKAALLDTGFGVGNLKAYVETLTDKPVICVITHCHIDHVNGAGWFDEIYLNPEDNGLYENAYRPERRKYEDFARKPEIAAIPFSDYAPKIIKPFIPYYDGDVFDLGGVHLKAIQVKGHSEGMTMILIQEDRYILFGDACGNQVGIGGDYRISIPKYLDQLKKVKAIEDQYDYIIRSHTGFQSPKELLDNVMDCCQRIIDGTDYRQKRERHGRVRYWAYPMNEKNLRADGKPGNVSYEIVEEEPWREIH